MNNKFSAIFVAVLCLFTVYSCGKKNSVNPIVNKVKPVANAPADTTIQLPTNSVTLKGSGSDSSGSIVSYLWSQVSGPNEATFENEGSTTVTLKGLIAGKYLFQFMVTNNDGLTGVDTVYVTVKSPTVKTLMLQPVYNPGEFAIGLLGNADYSSTGTSEDPLSAWTIDGESVTVRELIKFDLSSIPSNSTILSADIILFSDTIPINGDLKNANSGADNSVLVQQVATAWDPVSINWFNQPDGLTANEVTVPSTTLPFLTTDIDVKNIVSTMVSTNTNYGFKFSLVHETLYTSRIYCSSFYNVPTRRPKIIITYE